MRVLEAALIIMTLFILISNLFNLIERKNWLIYTPVAGLIILTAHGYIDGIRWQLYPIYFLLILYFFIFCWENLLKKDIAIFDKKKFVKIAAVTLSAILIITSATTLFVFPLKTIKK